MRQSPPTLMTKLRNVKDESKAWRGNVDLMALLRYEMHELGQPGLA